MSRPILRPPVILTDEDTPRLKAIATAAGAPGSLSGGPASSSPSGPAAVPGDHVPHRHLPVNPRPSSGLSGTASSPRAWTGSCMTPPGPGTGARTTGTGPGRHRSRPVATPAPIIRRGGEPLDPHHLKGEGDLAAAALDVAVSTVHRILPPMIMIDGGMACGPRGQGPDLTDMGVANDPRFGPGSSRVRGP